MSVEVRNVHVERMPLRNQVLLCLRIDGEFEDHIITRFAQQLGNAAGLPVVIVPQGIGLDAMNDQEMAKAGWIRAPKEGTDDHSTPDTDRHAAGHDGAATGEPHDQPHRSNA